MRHRWKLHLAVFIAGFIAISLLNFYLITHPTKISIPFHPSDFDMPSEDISFRAHDGVKLSGWLIEEEASTTPQEAEQVRKTEKNKKPVLIILHGYPADKGDMVFIASNLYPDFSLLLLDLRYFGESEGTATTLGLYEKRDLRAAVDFLMSRGYTEIGVFGFSLGGSTALMGATDEPRIDAVASYASYADIRTIGHDVYETLWIAKKPMVELMLLWSAVFFGEHGTVLRPEISAQKLAIPVLIIHSEDDEQIPFSHALRLKDALHDNPEAEFLFFKGRMHGDLPQEFDTKLKDFFTRALSAPLN